MNVERWIRGRTSTWQRVEELLAQIERRGIASLDRRQLHELGRLYRACSADLSRARAARMGADITGYLNNLVVKAHNQVYQRRKDRWTVLGNFLWYTFPALVREHILYIGAALALFVLPALACEAFVVRDHEFAHMELMPGRPIVSEEMWNMIEHGQMWTDSVQDASPLISSEIAANNIRVALLAFALGITFGLGTVWILCINGMMIGTVLGACAAYHMDYRLLSFVAPHGVLELSAIFICGGGGLLMGKALLFPGQWSRLDALKRVAKPAMGLFAGCLPILLVAGSIEGFISPRTDVTSEGKFLVSLATFVCLFLYLFVPRAERRAEPAKAKIEETGSGRALSSVLR